MKLAALIDHSAEVEPLQLPMAPLPLLGWPNIFACTFQLTYESLWVFATEMTTSASGYISIGHE